MGRLALPNCRSVVNIFILSVRGRSRGAPHILGQRSYMTGPMQLEEAFPLSRATFSGIGFVALCGLRASLLPGVWRGHAGRVRAQICVFSHAGTPLCKEQPPLQKIAKPTDLPINSDMSDFESSGSPALRADDSAAAAWGQLSPVHCRSPDHQHRLLMSQLGDKLSAVIKSVVVIVTSASLGGSEANRWNGTTED